MDKHSVRMRSRWARVAVSCLAAWAAHTSAFAGAYATPMQKAAAWLESQQDTSDGSWRDASPDVTFLQTAEAVLALHLSNRRNTAYYAGQTWIENHAATNIDSTARRLTVLRATESNASQDTSTLLGAVSTPASGQSGWGLAGRYAASPLDTALAMDALRSAGATFSSAQAIAYLKAAQITRAGEQGWSAAAADAADAYTTARVVAALAPYKASDTTLATPLSNAVNTLKAKVGTASAPHVRAATALAYLRMDAASVDARTLLNSLVTAQRTDGGYDAGVFAAGTVVQAMAAAEGADASASRARIDISDAALRQAINEALGRNAMDQVNQGEMAKLTTLDISNRAITSLNGLQYAVNLQSLNAANNQITTLANLSGLTKLTSINVSGNPAITRATSTSAVASAANPADKAVPLSVSVNVTGTRPIGSVRLLADGVLLQTLTLDATNPAVTSTKSTYAFSVSLAGGFRQLTAQYDGDANNAPSSSAVLTQMMNPDAAAILYSVINTMLNN